MINQLKVELFKIKRFYLLYIAALFYVILGSVYGYLCFPDTFNTNAVFTEVVCDTSSLFLISLVTAWFVGNDFGNRTVHNEIKTGYSRFSVLISRAIIVFGVSAILHFIWVFFSVVGFSVKYGFDNSVFSMRNLCWILVVFVQIMTLQSGVLLLVFLLKKVATSISGAMLYTFILCNMLRNFLGYDFYTLSCFCLVHDNSTHMLVISGIYAIILMMVFFMITHLLFRKAEIN